MNGEINSQFFRVLAWNLIQLRQGHRLTQDELAEKTGLSRQQISRIECGLGGLSFEALIQVADFFEVKVATLCVDLPRGGNIRSRLRQSFQEKGELKFAKEFSESPKIFWMELSPRRFRKMQIQKNYIYEFIGISGEAIIDGGQEVYEYLKPQEILSLKGVGKLRIRSRSDVLRSEILVIQNFAAEHKDLSDSLF